MIRYAVLFCICALVFPAASVWTQAPDLSKMDIVLQSVPDGPIAKVNGVNVSRDEFVGLYQAEITQMAAGVGGAAIKDEDRVAVGIRCIYQLIQRDLLYQEAKRRKLTVTEAELKKRWDEELERMKKVFPHAEGQEPSTDEILKATGVSKPRALGELQKTMLIDKVRDQIAKEKGVTVSDAEAKKFFDENKDKFKRPDALHLQQIFIATTKNKVPFDAAKKADARKRIESALKRIQAGESIEGVAKAVSEAPDKNRGGDMGMIPIAALPPFIVEPASKMKPGEMSGIIESELGFHIFKLIESSEGGDIPFDKAAPMIKERLKNEKMAKVIGEFCEPALSKPGAVEVYLQLEKTLAARKGLDALKEKSTPANGQKEAKPKEKKTESSAAKDAKPSEPAKSKKSKKK